MAKLFSGTLGEILGFWDNQLAKSEKKLNETLVSQIRAEFPALNIVHGEYPCNEQAYRHLSIDIASPEYGFLVFHRCRNIWYVASADRSVQQELGNTPAGASSMALVVWAERIDGRNFLQQKRTEWTAIHEEAGLQSGGMVEQIFSDKYEDIWMVAKGHGGALVTSTFGTDWLSKRPPSNSTEKGIFGHLSENRGLLASYGVSDEDIRAYWDSSGLEKAVQWLELNWLRVGATMSVLQSGNWDSIEDGMRLSSARAKRACPNYAGLAHIVAEKVPSSTVLPNELFPKTFGVFVEAFKTGGILGLEGLIEGYGSANEYVLDNFH